MPILILILMQEQRPNSCEACGFPCKPGRAFLTSSSAKGAWLQDAPHLGLRSHWALLLASHCLSFSSEHCELPCKYTRSAKEGRRILLETQLRVSPGRLVEFTAQERVKKEHVIRKLLGTWPIPAPFGTPRNRRNRYDRPRPGLLEIQSNIHNRTALVPRLSLQQSQWLQQQNVQIPIPNRNPGMMQGAFSNSTALQSLQTQSLVHGPQLLAKQTARQLIKNRVNTQMDPDSRTPKKGTTTCCDPDTKLCLEP